MMEHKYKSVLQFEKYIVKEIHYQANESYITCDDGISLDFDFDAQSYFSEDNKKMEVELRADVFKKAVQKNYPFEMSVSIKGFFCIETETKNWTILSQMRLLFYFHLYVLSYQLIQQMPILCLSFCHL